MKPGNVVLTRSYAFALRVVKLHRRLNRQKIEKELIGQLLRSGTSIGANVEEAVGTQSRGDFIHKLSIAYKEAREAAYWLRPLKDVGSLDNKLAHSFLEDIDELKRILASILKTSKSRDNKV